MFVEIYGRYSCPFCVMAENLAKKLKDELDDFDFKFIDMVAEGMTKQDLEPKVGGYVATVPQVFIDDEPIGGFTEFKAYSNAKFGI